MTETSGWDEFKQSLPIGSRVWCVVTRHEPFGVFVEISGVPFTGLVQITDFSDEGRMTVAEFPPVGSRLTALVLGFKETGQQIWLGVKPSQVGNESWLGRRQENCTARSVGLRVRSEGQFGYFGIEEVDSLLGGGGQGGRHRVRQRSYGQGGRSKRMD